MRHISIRRGVLALLFASAILPVGLRAAGPIKHYDIEARIMPEQGKMRATAALTLVAPEGGLDEIRLLLNRALIVRSVKCDTGVSAYTFDVNQPSGYRYAPTASPLVIDLTRPVEPGKSVVLRVEYEGSIEPDTWKTNVLTPAWVELGMYCAWYPLDPNSSSFTSRVTVRTDPTYVVTGSGSLSGSPAGWVLVQDEPAWDIIVIAARNLRVRRAGDERAGIEVWSSTLTEEQLDRFGNDAGRIITDLKNWLGPVANKRLRVVFAERTSGGGYYRPGFMTLIWDADYQGLIRYAAHEAAHFWWGRAPATTWEDWLNESFAEYSALMLIRSWYGPETFGEYLTRYEKEAEKAPPIWGLDRNHEGAYTSFYRKGPILLYRLEQKMGRDEFQRLLAALCSRQVKSTDRFLSTLHDMTSKEIRDSFERDLRR